MSSNEVFEMINALSNSGEDLIRTDFLPEVKEKSYNAFIINRFFSFFPDTLLLADMMNNHYALPKIMQHDFYMHAVRKMKRYGGKSWPKRTVDADRDFIARIYQCNPRVADSYLKILTKPQLQALRQQYDEGGTTR